jgi:hypothetical protein
MAKPAKTARPGNLVSIPDIPTLLGKHTCKSTPSGSSGIFSSANKEIKVLAFKVQHSTATGKDLKHLAELDVEGCSTWGLPFRLGPDGDNTLGSEVE